MADVFISYAREDRDRARDLAGHLEGRGWTVWWDRKLIAGQNFDEILTRQLEAAKSVVVLWSRHSVVSVWVKNEATLAERRGVLIPTRIEDIDLPMPFQLKETVDLSAWDGTVTSDELQFLFDSIAAARTGLPASDAPGESAGSSVERADARPLPHRKGSSDLTGARRRRFSLLYAVVGGLAIVAAFVAIEWRAVIPSLGMTARLIRAGGSGSAVPLDPALVRRLQDIRAELQSSLKPDLVLPDPHNASVLSVAQTVVARVDQFATPESRREEVATFFRAAAKVDCNCWTELTKPEGGLPSHIPASAWILYALADVGVGASESELSFLLDEQAPAGWWSFFPVGDERYASSYATAWALLALERQQSTHPLTGTLANRVSSALDRGSRWLAARHEQDAALWKDYPYLPNGRISRSISGVTLHAIHVVAPKAAASLEKQWLEALNEVPAADANTADYYWIDTLNDGSLLESFAHVDLPWMLVATTDAYGQGSRIQRAHALAWMEQALDQPSVAEAASLPDNWWRAELLIGLDYVLRQGAATDAADGAAAVH